MTERQTFTDEQLVAYLDGEVEFTPADEITAALAVDPELANRLAALDFNKDALQSGFSALLEDQKPPVLPAHPKAANNNWVMAGSMAASILVALFVGYGAGNFLNQPAAPGWKAYVVGATIALNKGADWQAKSKLLAFRTVSASPDISHGAYFYFLAVMYISSFN